MTAPGRQIPPNRREQSTRPVIIDNRKIYVSVGTDPKTGQVMEVFLRGGSQTGSDIDRQLDDVGVLISHLLQRAAPPEELAGAVGRLGAYPKVPGQAEAVMESPPATWIGAVLDVVVEESNRLKTGDLYERILAAGRAMAAPDDLMPPSAPPDTPVFNPPTHDRPPWRPT